MGNWPRPLAAMFFDGSNFLANFVEGHLVTMFAKLFSILTLGFREDF